MHSTTNDDLSEQSAAPALAAPGAALLLPPPSSRPARYRRSVVTGLFLLLVLVVLLLGGIAAFFAPGASITLTPRSALEQQRIAIPAVATPHQGQAQARFLQARTQTSRSTIPATGSGHQDAQSARGQVTFYNLATYSIAIPAGVTLTGRDGVQIVTESATQVPAGNPPTMGSATVAAHALHTGPRGNIAAGDIDVLCCADGIVVKNQQAFGGGRDARSFTAVSQADIDGAAAPLVSGLMPRARADLLGQARPGERSIPPTCAPQVLSDPPLGQEANQVTVSVSVTCRGAAYNARQVDSLAAAALQQQANAALGSRYLLAGQVTASEEPAGITEPHPGTLVIPVAVRGLWIYQIDRSALRALARQLAAKDPAAARAMLLRIPGVAQASIELSWNASTLPADSNQIKIVVGDPRKP